LNNSKHMTDQKSTENYTLYTYTTKTLHT